MKFFIKDIFSKCDQLVTFTEEILNENIHFLCCDNFPVAPTTLQSVYFEEREEEYLSHADKVIIFVAKGFHSSLLPQKLTVKN